MVLETHNTWPRRVTHHQSNGTTIGRRRQHTGIDSSGNECREYTQCCYSVDCSILRGESTARAETQSSRQKCTDDGGGGVNKMNV